MNLYFVELPTVQMKRFAITAKDEAELKQINEAYIQKFKEHPHKAKIIRDQAKRDAPVMRPLSSDWNHTDDHVQKIVGRLDI